jgi:hypothetical protein
MWFLWAAGRNFRLRRLRRRLFRLGRCRAWLFTPRTLTPFQHNVQRTLSIALPQQRRYCAVGAPTSGSLEIFISQRHAGLRQRKRSSRLTCCCLDFPASVVTIFSSCSYSKT